jgi:hypothetical protein
VAKKSRTSVAKEIKDLREVRDRAVDPIDAVGKRPYRAKQPSSMGFGREDAICE